MKKVKEVCQVCEVAEGEDCVTLCDLHARTGELLCLLRGLLSAMDGLLAWESYMGGLDSACWEKARRVVKKTRLYLEPEKDREFRVFVKVQGRDARAIGYVTAPNAKEAAKIVRDYWTLRDWDSDAFVDKKLNRVEPVEENEKIIVTKVEEIR